MSITAADATFLLSITGLFPVPLQLQGFAADDVFDTQPLRSTEVLMGVDGILSGGFVHVPVEQGISLQADSESAFIFDTWFSAQQANRDVFEANGIIMLTTLDKKWVMQKGFLTTYVPIPDAKRLVQPRKFGITWQRVIPSVI